MNDLKPKIIWYSKYIFETKFLFFVMLMFLIFWLLVSNFYINQKIVEKISVYENLISSKQDSLIVTPEVREENVDVYSYITQLCSKNNIEIRSFSKANQNVSLTLVGTTHAIKDFFYTLDESSRKNNLVLEKVELSFESSERTILTMEISKSEK